MSNAETIVNRVTFICGIVPFKNNDNYDYYYYYYLYKLKTRGEKEENEIRHRTSTLHPWNQYKASEAFM